MSLSFRPGHRVFIYDEAIDMRAGFNKLSMYVREKMKAKLVDGDLFLFLGKNRKRLKGLCYDGTGLVQISKKMERGRFMSISDLEFQEITVDELHSILHGSVIRRTKFGDEALTIRKESWMLKSDESTRARGKHRSDSPNGAVIAQRKSGASSQSHQRSV